MKLLFQRAIVSLGVFGLIFFPMVMGSTYYSKSLEQRGYIITIIDRLNNEMVRSGYIEVYKEGELIRSYPANEAIPIVIVPGSYIVNYKVDIFGTKVTVASETINFSSSNEVIFYVYFWILPANYLNQIIYGVIALVGLTLITSIYFLLRPKPKPILKEQPRRIDDKQQFMKKAKPPEPKPPIKEEPKTPEELKEKSEYLDKMKEEAFERVEEKAKSALKDDRELEEANYVNLTFQDIKDQKTIKTLEKNEGLKSKCIYKLTVSIDVKPDVRYKDLKRSEPEKPLQRPILETCELYAALFSLNERLIEVLEPQLGTIEWPSKGPSIKNAIFTIETGDVNREEISKLDLFIYYKTNLIYTAKIELIIQPSDYEWPIETETLPIIWWETEKENAVKDQILPGFSSLNEMSERGLNLAIQKDPERSVYHLTAFIGRAPFPGRVEISTQTLTANLSNMRMLLDGIRKNDVYVNGGYNFRGEYTGDYLGEKSGYDKIRDRIDKDKTKEVFDDFLKNIAISGNNFYYMLFKNKSGQIIKNLIESKLKKDDIIQIWIDRKASEFIYPWSWLYVGEVDSDPKKSYEVDKEKFWGYNYIIEQMPQFDETVGSFPKTQIEFDKLKIDMGFCNFDPTTQIQRNYFTNCVTKSQNSLELRMSDDDEEWENWLKSYENDIIYFFSHGHTAQLEANLIPITYNMLSKYIEWIKEKNNIPDDLEFIKQFDNPVLGNQTFIQLNKGMIFLKELVDMNLLSEPLVFLNMCRSAQIYPQLSEGLIDVFIRKGARGVIGTEIPMIDSFADIFARDFFDQVLYGDNKGTVCVGEALLSLRRKYLDKGNPLGFAYTYFGNSKIQLKCPIPQKG